MKKISLFSAIILVLVWAACSKSNSAGTPVTQSSVVGKWNRINNIVKSTPTSGPVVTDTAVFSAGSYSDFRTDGKVYTHNIITGLLNNYDTSTYQVLTNGKMVIGSVTGNTVVYDTATVTVSNSKLTLYLKETDQFSTDENWSNFSK